MSEIQITFQDVTVGNKLVKLITFVGQLDETNVDHEAKKVYQVITEMDEPILILDFSGLEYMNSKSIGYVTDWYSQVSGKNGTVSIVGPKPNILDILKVVGITQIVTIYNTADEAKAAISSGGGGEAQVNPAPQAAVPTSPAPVQPIEPVASEASAPEAPEEAPAAAPISTPPQEAPEAPQTSETPVAPQEPAMQAAGPKTDEPEAPTVPPVTPGV